jgi:type I site-specific restriction endonuclease
MMLAMATGTGKTFTAVSLIYRLIKSGFVKRVLFLVDRRALAAQASQAFSSFITPGNNKFNQEYEVFSQKFKKEDFEEGEKYDIGVMPNEYLTAPNSAHTFVYVATIQRMAINLFGREGSFIQDSNDPDLDEEADRIEIPIHAFDLIIADECHRGYTSKDTNIWRSVLNHFDAVKIGLTATPASHTVAYFGNPICRYNVEQAVLEGFLVDYQAVKIKSNVRIKGIFLKEGEKVGLKNPDTGKELIDSLEDEREFDSQDVERKITSPDSNHKILEEISKYALEHEELTGRFPKMLIFAVNDIPHISHADQLVKMAREIFGRDYNTKRLIKRLRRINDTMSALAREKFSAYIPYGDMGQFAGRLPDNLKNDFTETMRILRDKNFQDLLVNYDRVRTPFYVAYDTLDNVTSEYVFKYFDKSLKPADYLDAFSEFINVNKEKVEALTIIFKNPRKWNMNALREIRKFLKESSFDEEKIRKAHEFSGHKSMADIISMIKNAEDEQNPLITAEERVNKVIGEFILVHPFNEEQKAWLEYIREHLVVNLAIEKENFDLMPILERHGGLAKARKIFGNELEILIEEINYKLVA